MGVPDRHRRQAALAVLAPIGEQGRVPALDVGALKRLQRDRAEERRDLVLAQVRVSLFCPNGDCLERRPLLDPGRDKLADADLRSHNMHALVDGRDQLGELDLCLALRTFEAAIFGAPLAARVGADVNLELVGTRAALSHVSFHGCVPPGNRTWRARLAKSDAIMILTLSYLVMAASISALTGPAARTRAMISLAAPEARCSSSAHARCRPTALGSGSLLEVNHQTSSISRDRILAPISPLSVVPLRAAAISKALRSACLRRSLSCEYSAGLRGIGSDGPCYLGIICDPLVDVAPVPLGTQGPSGQKYEVVGTSDHIWLRREAPHARP